MSFSKTLWFVSVCAVMACAGARVVQPVSGGTCSGGDTSRDSGLGDRVATCGDAGDAWYLVTTFAQHDVWAHGMLQASGRSAMYEQWPLDEAATVRVGRGDDPSSDERAPYETNAQGRWLVDLTRGLCDAAAVTSESRSCVDLLSVERIKGARDDQEQAYRVSLAITRADGAHTWSVRADMKLAGRVDVLGGLLLRATLAGAVHVQASADSKQLDKPRERSVYDRPVAVTVARTCELPRDAVVSDAGAR